MFKNHNLAKHILDAAWSKLVTYTSYKDENAGRKVKEFIIVLSEDYLLTAILILLLIFSD